jgi:hypothetical protein
MQRYIFALMFVSLMLFSSGIAVAVETNPDKYAELLRSDLRTQKIALITKALDLSQEEGEKFWPIYRDYEQKLNKIVDARLANIKAYEANYSTMTNDKAASLVKMALKIDRSRYDLQKKYYGKIAKATSAVIAARFLQVESLVNNLVDLQIARQLPLVPKLEAVSPK